MDALELALGERADAELVRTGAPRANVSVVVDLSSSPDLVLRCLEEGLTVVLVEQQASFALAYTDRAYFLEKGEVRYEGPSAGLLDRSDLLRSVFLAGATAGFAGKKA